MDRRLIVTVAFVAHLLGGGMLALAHSVADVPFQSGQLEFLVLIGYLAPLLALALVWAKNYVYGAPLLVAATAANCWFAIYFFVVNDNPANVSQVAHGAYTNAVAAVALGSVVTVVAGTWVWYEESEGFRSAVDRVLFPPDSSD